MHFVTRGLRHTNTAFPLPSDQFTLNDVEGLLVENDYMDPVNITARAVDERRHGIGVLRAIGFSPGMVQLSFLVETSFLAILGIGLGLDWA